MRRRILRATRAIAAWFASIPGLRAFRGYRGPEQRSLPRLPDRSTHLDRRLERLSRTLAPGESGVALLANGAEALDARLSLVDLSGRSLDVQTYIWDLDRTGRRALSHLLAAADRGVRVRLLLDDTSTFRDELAFVALDRHPNVHVRFFNPIAQETGFPPKVEKNSIPLRSNDSAIALVVTTAPNGCPLPMGLPMVTMSGTTPWVSKAHQCDPTLPRPTWTSSAMQTPPAARTCR